MIFGGGYVVLPMLLQENIVSQNQFFQGFALIQALPGPLFNLSAFLGAASVRIAGAFVGALALFAPGVMLLLGVFPFWTQLRQLPGYKAFVAGVSAVAIVSSSLPALSYGKWQSRMRRIRSSSFAQAKLWRSSMRRFQ